MRRPRKPADRAAIPEDTHEIRYYRGKAAARVKASTILDAYMLLHLAGKGDQIRTMIGDESFELRAPAGFVNLLKDQIVTNQLHKVSNFAAMVARSDQPTCNDHPPPDDMVEGLLADTPNASVDNKD